MKKEIPSNNPSTTDLTINAVISDGGNDHGLTKIGNGLLILGGANTFGGDTKPEEGEIRLTNANALQNSTVHLAAGDTGTLSFGTLAAATFGGLKGERDLALENADADPVALSVGNNDQSTTYSGNLSGGGSLAKVGTGTLSLEGTNTYTGGTAINAGVLRLGSAGAIGTTGTVSFGGGILQYSAANQTDYSTRFSTAANQQFKIDTDGQTVTFDTALASDGGTLEKLGAGTLILTAANTYDGVTAVTAGTLQLGNGGAEPPPTPGLRREGSRGDEKGNP